jgi:hypothetical protein
MKLDYNQQILDRNNNNNAARRPSLNAGNKMDWTVHVNELQLEGPLTCQQMHWVSINYVNYYNHL